MSEILSFPREIEETTQAVQILFVSIPSPEFIKGSREGTFGFFMTTTTMEFEHPKNHYATKNKMHPKFVEYFLPMLSSRESFQSKFKVP